MVFYREKPQFCKPGIFLSGGMQKSEKIDKYKVVMSKATKAEAPQKVNYNDAVAESKVYFDGDDLAATVWVSKYALKDSFGNIY